MIRFQNETLVNAREITPTKLELKNELLIDDLSYLHAKFTKINNEWYFWKYVENNQLLNELIGSYLAKYIGLETAEYIPGVSYDEKLIVLSKNFRESYFKYFMANKLYKIAPLNFTENPKVAIYSTECLNQLNDNLKNEVLKLCILDIYMGQYERQPGNLMFKVKDTISLAPIYDYSASFDLKLLDYYINPFLVINMNTYDIEKLLNEYPSCLTTIQKLASLDMHDVLKEIEKKYNLKLDEEYEYYENIESVKFLKKFK